MMWCRIAVLLMIAMTLLTIVGVDAIGGPTMAILLVQAAAVVAWLIDRHADERRPDGDVRRRVANRKGWPDLASAEDRAYASRWLSDAHDKGQLDDSEVLARIKQVLASRTRGDVHAQLRGIDIPDGHRGYRMFDGLDDRAA